MNFYFYTASYSRHVQPPKTQTPTLSPTPCPCRTCQAIIMAEQEEEVAQDVEAGAPPPSPRKKKRKKTDKNPPVKGADEVYLEMLLSCGGTAMPPLLRCPTIWPSYTNRRATGCSSQPASPPPPPTPAPPPPALPPTPWQNKAASLSLSSQSRDVPARPVHSLEHEVVPELIKRAQAAAYHRSIPATRSSPVLSFLDQSRPLPARPRQQGDRV